MSKQTIFNSILVKKPRTNYFDMSYTHDLTCNMGEMVPVMLQDVIPGDKIKIGCESLVRMAPMVSPVMHRINVHYHTWFVPNRILWEGWEKFITNTPDPTVLPAFPTITFDDLNHTKLADWLGIPPPDGSGNTETVSAIPFAVFQCIYNHKYRDQNLIPEVDYKLINGDNSLNTALLTKRYRAWKHDYLTSCLPEAQKGDPVTIPISGFNDVPLAAHEIASGTTAFLEARENPGNISVGYDVEIDNTLPDDGNIYAKTSEVVQGQTTINDLRVAERVQQWLERAMRAGSRLTEVIWAHFGVKSPDARLQLPEYISGSTTPIQISEVLNTAGTEDQLPQGNMAGHGFSVTNGNYGDYYVQEHGYIMTIATVMPEPKYDQGIDRHWYKITDPFEYYWDSFAHLGEQEVLNREVFAYQGMNATLPFGYQPRYNEYRYNNNRVSGDFRSNLAFWTLSRKFLLAPSLNQEFIECKPRTDIFAVDDLGVTDKIYMSILNKIGAVRGIPKHGIPSL